MLIGAIDGVYFYRKSMNLLPFQDLEPNTKKTIDDRPRQGKSTGGTLV